MMDKVQHIRAFGSKLFGCSMLAYTLMTVTNRKDLLVMEFLLGTSLMVIAVTLIWYTGVLYDNEVAKRRGTGRNR